MGFCYQMRRKYRYQVQPSGAAVELRIP
jgi:hypothetical protein